MNRTKYLLLICFTVKCIMAQSINIDTGSNLDVGLGSDVCAGEYGNIVGNLTGEGSECGEPIIVTNIYELDQSSIPATFAIHQNYPNPFNPKTIIKYALPSKSLVTLKVYNLLGEEITTLVKEVKEAGTYEVEFDAASLPSGIYLYRLNAGEYVATKKMLLLK